MASGVEKEIRNLLNILPHKNQVADELLKKWHRGVLSNSEKSEVASFLFKIGFHKSLLSEMIFQNDKDAFLPVEVCLYLYDEYSDQLKLSDHLIEAIFLWAESSENTDTLIRMNKLVEKSDKLKKLRELSIETDLGHAERQLQIKKRHLQALLMDSMWEEAENLIGPLLENFTEDLELNEIDKKIRYGKAIATINAQSNKPKDQIPVKSLLKSWNKSGKDQEEEEIAVDHMLKLAEEQPEWNYDIAVALFCMGKEQDSFSLIQSATDKASFFLKMEILLEERRFLEVLEEIRAYKPSKDSEQLQDEQFSLSYIESKALWGADRKKEAVTKIEEIIKIRPDFRIAESLHREWTRELEL